MKIVLFQGGLGNQLFQVMRLKSLENECGQDVRYYFRKFSNSHGGFEVNKYFTTNIKPLPWFIEKIVSLYDLFFSKIGKEPFKHNEDNRKVIVLNGYWQDKKYLIKDAINFKELTLNEQNKEILDRIKNTNSISIHVRRGDYLLPQYFSIYGNVCTETYYRTAIEKCYEMFDSCDFFIFSDDIDWVKKNLHINKATYVYWNKGNNSVLDMYLMSFCKVNIIANSTFSFWAAYLNKNDNLVFYPKKWYNSKYEAPNIFPDEWIGLNS